MAVEPAVTALVALAGPSMSAVRSADDTVTFGVFSVHTRRKQLVLPLTYDLEVEIFVRLHEATQRYTFSGRSFERHGFSMSTESFRGVYRRREWGKHLTLDGVVPVKFDTGGVFDRIESALQPLGWGRG